MFRAIDLTTHEPIIILDRLSLELLTQTREQCRAGMLGCPRCRIQVVLKAGEVIRHHFAHKSRCDCPMRHEPADLMAARAALYNWLKTKFRDGTVLPEETPEGVSLLRPFDCWVVTKAGRRFAYQLRRSITRSEQNRSMTFPQSVM